MPYYNDPYHNLSLRQAISDAYSSAPEYNPEAHKSQLGLGFESARHGFKANEYYEKALAAREANDPAKEKHYRTLARAEEIEAARYNPAVQNMTDIRGLGDFVNWGLSSTGQMAASMGPTLLGSIGGRLAGAATGAALGSVVPGIGNVAGAIGGFLGGAIPGYLMERNETIGEAMREDPENKLDPSDIRAASRVKGGLAGAAEAFVPSAVGKGLISPVGKIAGKGIRNALGRGSFFETALAEGATEGTQSLIGQAAQNYLFDRPLTEFDYWQALNEAAAGAVGGGVLGAGAKGVHYAKTKLGEQVDGLKEKATETKEKVKDVAGATIDAARDTFGQQQQATATPEQPEATVAPQPEATVAPEQPAPQATPQAEASVAPEPQVAAQAEATPQAESQVEPQAEPTVAPAKQKKKKFSPKDLLNFSQEAGTAQSDYWLDKQGRPISYKGKPVTKAQGIRASLTRHFKGINEANKNILIANNVDEILQTMGQDPHAVELARAIENDPAAATNYKAFTTTNADGTPRVVMIANNIRQGEEFGVFLHEVGVHVGMRNAFRGNEVTNIANTVRDLTQDKDELTRQIAQKALARAEGGARLDEEVVAYFVEEAMRATDANGKPLYQPKALKQKQSTWRKVVDKVISLIKAFLERLGVKSKTPLTPQQIIDTAWGLAQKETQNFAAQENVAQPSAATPVNSTTRQEINNVEMLNLARHLFDETPETQMMTEEEYDDSLVERATKIANDIQSRKELFIPEIQEATTNFLADQDYNVFVEQINAFMPQQVTEWRVERVLKSLGINNDTVWSTENSRENILERAFNEREEFVGWATGEIREQWNKQDEESNTYLTDGVVRESMSPNFKFDDEQERILDTIFAVIFAASKDLDYREAVDVFQTTYGNKLPKVFHSIYQYMQDKNEKDGLFKTFSGKNFGIVKKLQSAYENSVEKTANSQFENLLGNLLFNSKTQKTFRHFKKTNRAKYEAMRDKAQQVLLNITHGISLEKDRRKVKVEDSSAYEMTPSAAAQGGSALITKIKLNRLGELFAQMVDNAHPERTNKKASLFVKKNKEGERVPLDITEWRAAIASVMSDDYFIDAYKVFIDSLKPQNINGKEQKLVDTSGYYDRLQDWIRESDKYQKSLENSASGEIIPNPLTPLMAVEFFFQEFQKTEQSVIYTNETRTEHDFKDLFNQEQVQFMFLYPENFNYNIPWLQTLIQLKNPFFQANSDTNINANDISNTGNELSAMQAAMFRKTIKNTSELLSTSLNEYSKPEYTYRHWESAIEDTDVDNVETIDDLFELANNKQEEMFNADDEELFKSQVFDDLAQLVKDEGNAKGGFQTIRLKPRWTVIPNAEELNVYNAYERDKKTFAENQDIPNLGKANPEPKLNSVLLADVAASHPLSDSKNWLSFDNPAVQLYLEEKIKQGVEYQKVSPLIGSLLYFSSHMGDIDPAWIWSKENLQKKVLAFVGPHWAARYLKGDHTKAEVQRVKAMADEAFSYFEDSNTWITSNLDAALELAKLMAKDESAFMIVLNEPMNAGGDTFNVAFPNIKTAVRVDQLDYLLGTLQNKYLDDHPEAVAVIEDAADNAVFIDTKDAQGNYTTRGVSLKKLLADVQRKDRRFQIEDPNTRDWANPNDTSFYSLFCAAIANLLYVDPNATGRLTFAITPSQQKRAGLAPTGPNDKYETFMISINDGIKVPIGKDKDGKEILGYLFENSNRCYRLLWNKIPDGKSEDGFKYLTQYPPIGVRYKGKEIFFDDPFLTGEDLQIATQVQAVISPSLSDLRGLQYDGNMEKLLERLPITGIPKYLELFPETQDKEALTWLETLVRVQQQNERYQAKSKFGYNGESTMPRADFWSIGKALFEQSRFTPQELGRMSKAAEIIRRQIVNNKLGTNLPKGIKERVVSVLGPKGPIIKTIQQDNFSIDNVLEEFRKAIYPAVGEITYEGEILTIGKAEELAREFIRKLNQRGVETERNVALNPNNDFTVPLEFELTSPDNKEFQERARKILIDQYFQINKNSNRYLAENMQAAEKYADDQLADLSNKYKEILKKPDANALEKISRLYDRFYFTGNEKLQYTNNSVLDPIENEVALQFNKHRQFGREGLLIDPNNIFSALFAPLHDALNNTTKTDANAAALEAIQDAINVIEKHTDRSLGFYVAKAKGMELFDKGGTMRVTARVPKQLIQDLVNLWYEISAAEQEIPGTERWVKVWDEEAQKRLNATEGYAFENAEGKIERRRTVFLSEIPQTPKDEFINWEREYDKKFGLDTLLNYPEFKEAKDKFEKETRTALLQERGIDSELSYKETQEANNAINEEVQKRVDEWVKEQQAGAFLSIFKHDIENLGRELMAALRMGESNAGEKRRGTTSRADHLWGESPKVYLKSTGERIESESPWHHNRNPIKTFEANPFSIKVLDNKGREMGSDQLKGAKGAERLVIDLTKKHATNVPKNKKDLRITSAGIAANRPDLLNNDKIHNIDTSKIDTSITNEAYERPDFTDESRLIDFWFDSADNNWEDIHSTSMGTDKHVFKQRKVVEPANLNNEIVDRDYVRLLNGVQLTHKSGVTKKEIKTDFTVDDFVNSIKEQFAKMIELNKKRNQEGEFDDRKDQIEYDKLQDVVLRFNTENLIQTKADASTNLQDVIVNFIGLKKKGEWIKKSFLPQMMPQQPNETDAQYSKRLINYGMSIIRDKRIVRQGDSKDKTITKFKLPKIDKQNNDVTVAIERETNSNYIDIKWPFSNFVKIATHKLGDEFKNSDYFKFIADAYIKGSLLPQAKNADKEAQTQYENEAFGDALNDWDNMIVNEKARANKLRLGNKKQIEPIKIEFNPKGETPGALFHPAQYSPINFELPDAEGNKRDFASPLHAFRSFQSGKFDAKAYHQVTKGGKHATFPLNLAGENTVQDDEALDLAATILQQAYEQDPYMLENLQENNFYKDKEFVFDLGGTSRKPKFWEENYPNVLRAALFRIEQDLKNNPDLIQQAQESWNNRENKEPLETLTRTLDKDKSLNILAEAVYQTNLRAANEEKPPVIRLRVAPAIRRDGKKLGTKVDENGNEIANPHGAIFAKIRKMLDPIFGRENASKNMARNISDFNRIKAPAPVEENGYWYAYLSAENLNNILENYLSAEGEYRNINGVNTRISDNATAGLKTLAKMIMEGGFLEENSNIDPLKRNSFYKKILGENTKIEQYRTYFNRPNAWGHIMGSESIVEPLPENNDDVPFSKLFMESPLDTQERKKRAEEWMAKVLPTDIAREFVEMEKWGDKESYGKFTNKDGKKLISLALTGDVLSTAHHEAFHAFLSTIKENAPKHYDKLMQLSQKYKDVVVKVLTDKKADNALKDIENNPEELATYAYQLWMANLIPNNALTKRVAGRLGRMWLRAAGFFNDELRRKGKEADSVLEAETKLMLLYKRFNDGAIGPNHSQDTFYRQLEADMSPTKLQERWNKVANFIGKYGDQLLNATDTVLRRTDIPELIEIADMFYVDVVDHDMSSMHAKGEKGGALSRYRQTRFRWENQYNEIIEELSEKEKNKIRQALLNIDSDAALKSLGESQKMMDAYKKMREFFKNIFTETLHKSGMKFKTQGNPSAHFFPFLWSRDAIKANRQEFINLLAEEYDKEIYSVFSETGKKTKVTPRERAEKITSEILGETLDKYKDRPFWITPGMFEQNVESAYLSFIKDRQKFDKFFVQSLDTVMHEYLVRGSKNATFREVFGNDGKKLHDLFEKATARIAEKHGLINPLGSGVFDTVTFHDIRSINNNDIAFAHVSEKYKGREQELRDSIAKLKEIMAPYYRAVDSMTGLLGTDMSPQLRKFNAIGVTYQNIRLLIGVLFSSFQDIAGLSMHGGGLKDQWQGLVRGLREGFGVALKKKSKDYMIKRAEEFGIVAPLSSIGMVQELTGTQHLTGFWGKANKTFFRINLMEGWNRGLRAQAMVIAERKLEDWAKSKALDPDIPTDSLLFKRCYGSKMKPGDIELDGDGHIANNEANRIALGRIVDDMIMNPTEANRPMWANDPRFMLFAQLKTFSYTLHRVMLRGVAEQLRLGNYAPATAALMGMVPMALTGYIAKEMILGMIDDDDDDWKFRLENVIPYAINRSGIGGIPQMYLEDILDVDPARLFGPTVDQIQNILSIPLRGWNPEYLPGRVSHMRNWNNELVAAMPAGTYLRRIPGLVDGSA